MCTVSYIPLTNNKFILTSNRDELNSRLTQPPMKWQISQTTVWCPRDMKAGGSWIGVSELGRVSCLLNGAYEKHEPGQRYERSRGLVLLESFACPDLSHFYRNCALENVEPFTLVTVEQGKETELYTFRWDGTRKHLRRLRPEKAHIWSSVTLYPEPVRKERKRQFTQWMETSGHPKPEDVLDFHTLKKGFSKENEWVMERTGGLQTVSLTQIIGDPTEFSMLYLDRVENRESIIRESFKNRVHV